MFGSKFDTKILKMETKLCQNNKNESIDLTEK